MQTAPAPQDDPVASVTIGLTVWRCRRAVTAIEYSLIAALVSLAVIVGASRLGVALNKQFTDISNTSPY